MSRNKDFVVWLDTKPLTSGESRIVETGNVSSTMTIVESTNLSFLTFGIKSSHNLTITIEGCFNTNFNVADACFTLAVPATTYHSPYDMPAPFNETGWLVLNQPYTRIKIADTATANHTYTRLFARAWE